MRYTPDTIAQGDIPVARKHVMGGEKELYATRVLSQRVGELFMAGDGSGVWTADSITTLPETGSDLVIKVDGELRSTSAAAVAVTVVGTDQDDGLLSGTANFNPPSWVQNKSYDFGEGQALDITPNNLTKKFKTITAVVAPNGKKGSKLSIHTMPADTDWQPIDMVEDVTPNVGIRPGVSVPNGLDGTAEVLRGRSEESSLSISILNRSTADGLQRYAGTEACFRLDIKKGGALLVERHVYSNAIIRANPNFGDGSDLSKQGAEGLMEDAFFFVAR